MATDLLPEPDPNETVWEYVGNLVGILNKKIPQIDTRLNSESMRLTSETEAIHKTLRDQESSLGKLASKFQSLHSLLGAENVVDKVVTSDPFELNGIGGPMHHVNGARVGTISLRETKNHPTLVIIRAQISVQKRMDNEIITNFGTISVSSPKRQEQDSIGLSSETVTIVFVKQRGEEAEELSVDLKAIRCNLKLEKLVYSEIPIVSAG